MRALTCARGDLPFADVFRQRRKNLRQVRVGTNQRWPFERAREVAIAAMRGAAFCQIDTKVRARRDRLQLPLRFRSHHHSERRLRRNVGGPRIFRQLQIQPIRGKLDHLDPGRGRALCHRKPMLPAARAARDEQLLRTPYARFVCELRAQNAYCIT